MFSKWTSFRKHYNEKIRKIIIFHSFAFSEIYGTQYKIWDMHYCCLMRLSLFTRIKEVLCHLHTIGKWRKSFVRYNMRFCKIEDWNRIYIVTMSSLRDYMIRISFLCNAHTLLKRKYKYKVIRSYLRLDFHSGKHENHFSRQNQKLV